MTAGSDLVDLGPVKQGRGSRINKNVFCEETDRIQANWDDKASKIPIMVHSLKTGELLRIEWP